MLKPEEPGKVAIIIRNPAKKDLSMNFKCNWTVKQIMDNYIKMQSLEGTEKVRLVDAMLNMARHCHYVQAALSLCTGSTVIMRLNPACPGVTSIHVSRGVFIVRFDSGGSSLLVLPPHWAFPLDTIHSGIGSPTMPQLYLCYASTYLVIPLTVFLLLS